MRLFAYEDLVNAVEPPWVVPGWIAEKDTVLLYGPTMSYKTFLALDMLLSVATGRPWAGLPCAPRPVLYIAAEGASGFAKRVRAWAGQRGIPENARFLLEAVRFGDRGESLEELFKVCAEQEFHPELVAVDTLAASMLGGDESSAQDIGVVMAGVHAIRDQWGAAVTVVDHTGWDESRERGSSSKRQYADVVIKCERVGDRATRLTQEKNRNAAPAEPLTMKLAAVGDSLLPDRLASDADEITAPESAMLHVLISGPLKHGPWQLHGSTPHTTFGRCLPRLLDRGLVLLTRNTYSLTDKGLRLLQVHKDHIRTTQDHGPNSPSQGPPSTPPIGGVVVLGERGTGPSSPNGKRPADPNTYSLHPPEEPRSALADDEFRPSLGSDDDIPF